MKKPYTSRLRINQRLSLTKNQYIQPHFFKLIFFKREVLASVVGVGLLGFTLSYDEFTRTSLISGETNTLPLEIFGMTTNVTSPSLYALGTLTTIFSFVLIGVALFTMRFLSRRQTK